MGALQAIANLVGLSVEQLIFVTVVGVALIVGWYVLKLVLRIARKAFSIGCLGIGLLVCVLYAALALVRGG